MRSRHAQAVRKYTVQQLIQDTMNFTMAISMVILVGLVAFVGIEAQSSVSAQETLEAGHAGDPVSGFCWNKQLLRHAYSGTTADAVDPEAIREMQRLAAKCREQ